ncbi:MAG: hypothetical protein COT74_03210 [Bdellovibrionales bacterium CG10_big_fil_rev_8_21_14_0_10_45_34]|nr:MAG: hypothetical protein COT74_03210 [Bdellovibrionales bacterium CG10_big_fil_rev_8_21_14_0_10_45_34]
MVYILLIATLFTVLPVAYFLDQPEPILVLIQEDWSKVAILFFGISFVALALWGYFRQKRSN